jgi:hypothetical protein
LPVRRARHGRCGNQNRPKAQHDSMHGLILSQSYYRPKVGRDSLKTRGQPALTQERLYIYCTNASFGGRLCPIFTASIRVTVDPLSGGPKSSCSSTISPPGVPQFSGQISAFDLSFIIPRLAFIVTPS